MIIPTPEKRFATEDCYIQETMRRFEVMFAEMKKKTEATFRWNAKLYSGRTNEFVIGDLVWCFSKRKVEGKPQKITDAWLGPYKVIGKPAEVLLEVKPADTGGCTKTVHVTTVRRYQGPRGESKYQPPREEVGDDDGDELAEELGRPERWIEPADGLVIPIQVPSEPEPMMDLPSRGNVQGSSAGAGPSGTQPPGPTARSKN